MVPVQWQRLKREAQQIVNQAAAYSEQHRLGEVFEKLHEELTSHDPEDPAAFLTEVISAIPSLEAYARPETNGQSDELLILHFNDVCLYIIFVYIPCHHCKYVYIDRCVAGV